MKINGYTAAGSVVGIIVNVGLRGATFANAGVGAGISLGIKEGIPLGWGSFTFSGQLMNCMVNNGMPVVTPGS